MECIFNNVQDRTGAAVNGAYVYVYTSLNALATLYSDNGVTPTPNPTITNLDGEYQFFAANGTYSIVVTATGYVGQSIPGVILFDPIDAGLPTSPVSIANGGTGGTTVTTAATNLQGTGLDANAVGFRMIPQNSRSADYTVVASDSGKHVFHPFSDAVARTFTIASNASVSYPIGTALTFVNQSVEVLTIAIDSDTMTLANDTATGNRTLAQNGVATAIKIGATSWLISGVGLT
jgi:hypothetical protein